MSKKPKRPKPLTALELRKHTVPFLTNLESESERGAALIGAAFLEDVLRECIRVRLVDDEKVAAQLFAPGGACDSFSKKISMAYMLGLIGPKFRRDLDNAREIRIRFAHYHRTVSFNDPDISALSLSLASELVERLSPALAKPSQHEPRGRFTFFVTVASVTLQEHRRIFKRLSVGAELTGGIIA